MDKKKIKNECKRYLIILLGCFISSLGFNLFLIPGHLLSGGFAGIAIVFYYLYSWPIGIQLFIYNIPVLYLAYRAIGKLYALDTIIGTVMFSVCIDLTHFLVNYSLVQDTMLNAIFGGVLAGIGFGFLFRANANGGGIDVIAAAVKKYYSLDLGMMIFAMNLLIISANVVLFDIETALFTVVSLYLTAELTNRVVAGFNREKTIFIISPESQKIADLIMARVERGVTIIDGKGAFTHQRKDILFVVVSLTQVNKIKNIVASLDPAAFMMVSDTSEVMGKGFTIDNKLEKAQNPHLKQLKEITNE